MRLYSPKKDRIVEIDFIRGILIIFMMVDHFFYDFMSGGALNFIFPGFAAHNPLAATADWYWMWDVRIVTRFIILSTFFLLSGISCYFSKNNLKRGILLSIVGALISAGFSIFSKIANESMYVFFGAISSFGLSVLIYTLLKYIYDLVFKENKKFFKYILLVLGAFSIWLGVYFGVFTKYKPDPVPLRWDTFINIIIGKNQQSNSADWLPLFPYIGFMFIGATMGEVLYEQRISYFFPLPTRIDNDASTIKKIGFYSLYPYKGLKAVICFSGKYSLYFYILHQPAIILICSLILLMLGYKIQL